MFIEEFEEMSAGEILEWLRGSSGWSMDCFTDEILPILRRKVAELEGETLPENMPPPPWRCVCGWEGEKKDCVPAECDTFRCPECNKYITVLEEEDVSA
jgi:hypothetical protein